MSFDNKNGRFCDQCGRNIKNAHRIYQGREYCGICYPRVFIKKPCSRCGKPARAHKFSESPVICSACDIETRVCLRCGKPVPRAGKLVNGKPVCPSCTPYLSDPKICTSCGKPSVRLARAPKFGLDNLMCDSCRNKLTHKTCGFCRKYRPVFGTTEKDISYCASCIPGKQVYHSCPGCGCAVPGVGRSRCYSCLNLNRLMKEVDLQALTLNRQWTRDLMLKFALWLHERSGSQPNCFKLFASHEPFFERLDAQFESAQNVQEKELLENFGVGFIRKHLLASIFLQEKLGITIRTEAKIDHANQVRIREKIVKSAKESWAPLLKNYYLWLDEKPLSTLTKRLYLRAAENFCQSAKLEADRVWKDGALDSFLNQNPGSRASLFRFVTYCRLELGWEVTMPQKKISNTTNVVPRLKSLFKQVEAKGVEAVDPRILIKILALSLGYQHADFLAKTWTLETTGDQSTLISGEEKILLVEDLVSIASTWIAKR